MVDDDTRDLIAQLCTRIGMIMEDTSVDALTLRARHPATWQRILEDIGTAVAAMTMLIHAAQALHAGAMETPNTLVNKSPVG